MSQAQGAPAKTPACPHTGRTTPRWCQAGSTWCRARRQARQLPLLPAAAQRLPQCLAMPPLRTRAPAQRGGEAAGKRGCGAVVPGSHWPPAAQQHTARQRWAHACAANTPQRQRRSPAPALMCLGTAAPPWGVVSPPPPPLRPPMLKSACLFVHVCRWAATACAPLCVSPTQLAAMHVPPHLPATPGRPHLCSAGGRPRRWPRPRGESLIARCDTKGWVWRAGRAQGRTAEPPSATLAQALQRRHFGRTSRATGPPPFTSTRRGRRASAAPTQRPRRAGAAVQPGAAGPTPQRCAAPPPGCGWPTS